MGKILEALANDKLADFNDFSCTGAEYKAAIERLCMIEDQFLERIGTENRDVYESYTDAFGAVHGLECTSRFVHGYCLGALVAEEVSQMRARLLQQLG